MTEQLGEWYFECREAKIIEGFLAWCAKTPDLGEGPLDVPFELTVYFEFGSTAEEALKKLKRQVLT